MRIHSARDDDLSAELAKLSASLDIRKGMTAADSGELTRAVFGEALSPIESVRRILGDIAARGDAAVREYTHNLDGVELSPAQFRVSSEEIAQAWEQTPPELRAAMETAAENIRRFQEAIRPKDAEPVVNPQGGVMALRALPIRRVACYVPGGRASYPSSVLMTAVPAQVAGVREVVVTTPCGADGAVRPATLAAARVAGVTEIYRLGGAQAIAALAFGTETIEKVDKIVGPGNLFVTLAKKEVYGQVDLDMLAGPSEILIIADAAANPGWLAADLLSQAEHDPAASVLLTPSREVAETTVRELEKQLPELSRESAARDCLQRYGFIGVTRDLDEAAELANQFAPEHLELAVADPEALLPKCVNAGAVFMGQQTPEPLGDYLAGPSHVLPTGGTARFFSGLSVHDFLRRTSVLKYTKEALAASAEAVDVFARAEGLDAHARSVTRRVDNSDS